MLGNGKISEHNKLNSSGQNWTRLSYEMLFQESSIKKNDYKSGEEISELLSENDHIWKERLEEAKRQAHEAAYKQGFSAGMLEAIESIAGQLQPVRDAINEADGRIEKLLDELKPHLVSLVFDLAEKVLDIPVHSDELKEKVSEEIQQTLKEIEEDAKINIAISADDFECISQLTVSAGFMKNTEITYDDALKPGEYRIETPFEMIVKNFRKMLNDMKESTIISESVKLSDDVSLH